jgi:hypothetical protein
MPLATAAVCDRPVARRSKPNRVLFSSTQKPTPTTTASRQSPQIGPSWWENGYQPGTLEELGSVLVRTELPPWMPYLSRK